MAECFSQNKDELIMVFLKENEEFILKAHLRSTFSCLSFPDQFNRARKNSVDIFPELTNQEVESVFPYPHERAFSIKFTDHFDMIFKLFGNNSNILLFQAHKNIDVFKHGLTGDLNLNPESLKPATKINISGDIALNDLPKTIRSFDKTIIRHLGEKGYQNASEEDRKSLLNKTIKYLDSPQFYVFSLDDKLKLSLFSPETDAKTFSDPIAAINHFYNSYQKKFWLESEKGNLIKKFRSALKKSKSYILNSNKKLEALTGDINYHQIGDIIMSNLSSIKPGIDRVTLFDFYNERNLEIKLKPTLSPQKNAENYYRKGKNQKKEIDIINRNISNREKEVEIIEKQVAGLNGIEDLKTLKNFINDHSLTVGKTAKQSPPQFKVYSHLGFKILVGRNAKNNDLLTFRYSYKEDLWLHAKDVTGSHVLIKYQSGKSFPKPVIEKAAQLAAFYSKNKNSNACPVILTEKKYVRKSKGLPPGAVILDKEKMLMVQPMDYPQDIES